MASENRNIMTLTLPSDLEIVMTRTFNAPREMVFKASTKPEHVAQWWGPRGFTTVCEIDLRPGGHWRFVQRGPDGNEYAFHGVYREVVPPERLVYTFEFEGMPGHVALETVTLQEHDGKTKMTDKLLFKSVEDRNGMLQSGMESGAAETWERLDEHLTVMAFTDAATSGTLTGDPSSIAAREIKTTRVFNAPRELVFQVWTDPEHVAQWWGPNGFTNTIQEMNVRPGGVWRFIMHGPDGVDYDNKVVFLEVVKPELLVYIHGDEGRPDYFHVTVNFAEQGNQTRLTMQLLFKTAEERDEVVQKHGAAEGLNQTLGRLEAYLAKTG